MSSFWNESSLVFHSPELAMPAMKMPRNHSREYWYMGSTLERSETQKKRICVRTDTGTYSSRVASMSRSVSSATITLACDRREVSGTHPHTQSPVCDSPILQRHTEQRQAWEHVYHTAFHRLMPFSSTCKPHTYCISSGQERINVY
ncbi:hypothetical protein SKAU_G00176260 [Synaphobranchus kaupii]|uniref:Uncharacterized protein n=1 Tax=Synaphobranchus kaupii TaxID=118154 RepID=A0A9Q1FLH5_SYNKA|nr:hypothetical protein SKAU_G00176260 [Synaphobranchus kaupii]